MKYSKYFSKTYLFLIIINSAMFPQAELGYHSIADSIISTSLNNRIGYEWLKELCEIGPRLSGSKNLENAISWAKKKMDSLEFEVWLQPVSVAHWERGNIETAEISESKLFKGKKLNIASLGGSVSTPQQGITAEVLEVKNFEELYSKRNEAKGKIIFFSRAFYQAEVNTFSGYGSAVDQRSIGALEAAKYGGAASIIRSVTTKYDTVPHVGAIRNYVDSLPKIPAAALGYLDADFLSSALKEDPSLKITLKLDCRTLPNAQSYNVVADLKGSEFPEELIVVAGHFDSWDKGHGAHDDGAGCIQALEVLNIFQRLDLKPKRTIRCIFYANEENGIAGAKKYGDYSDTSSFIHYAAIESDRGAFTPRGFTIDSDSVNHDIIISKLKSWLPVLKKAGIEWITEGGSGVDISRISKAKALIGYVPDDQRYFDFHHSANDVFEEVHPREMQLGTAAIAILTFLISEEGLE